MRTNKTGKKIKNEYRIEVDAVFLNIQQKHIEEMAEIEEHRLIDVSHEEQRGTVNDRMAAREARRLARDDQLVVAIEMKELSEKTLEKERDMKERSSLTSLVYIRKVDLDFVEAVKAIFALCGRFWPKCAWCA
jgi:hypothetical protein